MKKFKEIKKYVVVQKKLNLFVAESHYFDDKGNRQLTLTDKEELAEQMSLTEANILIESLKDAKSFRIHESETAYEEEVDYGKE